MAMGRQSLVYEKALLFSDFTANYGGLHLPQIIYFI